MFMVPARWFSIIATQVMYMLLIFFIFFEITHTWTDNKNRAKMVYAVNNDFLKGILTTQIRAGAINEFLNEAPKYIRQNDYLLAFYDIPMIYAITGTRPFIHNSWPALYDRSVLKNELD